MKDVTAYNHQQLLFIAICRLQPEYMLHEVHQEDPLNET